MSWPEVETAKAENRHEIILSGPTISERITTTGLDPAIFTITSLNYLNIHDTELQSLPDEVTKLVNLQTLVLHSNKLTTITSVISQLDKLKILDLSRNKLTELPVDIAKLVNLTTINVSSNELESFPKLSNCGKLQVLDVANNKLSEFPDICYPELVNLTDLKVNSNGIEAIPTNLSCLGALKNFDISKNKVKVLPGELVDCNKLKEINVKENPITDRRLFKLIDQCRTKQVLDYVKQHCKRTTVAGEAKQAKAKGKKGRRESESSNPEATEEPKLKITVLHCQDETIRVILQEAVKKVRGHILACLLLNVEFTEESFKKFIQLQTKLHDSVCEKRNAATIATHDASKLGAGNVTYTALPPKRLKIKPLNRAGVELTGEELFAKLQAEAENLRKEKKRNVYSGIHKYLYLLEGQKMYPCLTRDDGAVISFPPITNSDITKISAETKTMFIEVTSATSLLVCKKVLDTLLKDTALLLDKDLTVQQVKNTDPDGNLKSVYPSKTDLVFEDGVKIAVIRE